MPCISDHIRLTDEMVRCESNKLKDINKRTESCKSQVEFEIIDLSLLKNGTLWKRDMLYYITYISYVEFRKESTSLVKRKCKRRKRVERTR